MSDESPGETQIDAKIADRVADLADRIARGEQPDLSDDPYRVDLDGVEHLLPTIRLLSAMAGQESPGCPSEILGDFRLGREIGRGGIGVVYEATQVSLGRKVAVKVLPQASRLDPRQRRRFQIEAQAAAGLQHPNIVPVFASGEEGGVPYLAMRLIEGRNLAQVVRERREVLGCGLPPRRAAELARQAAEAIGYAHRHDVLHRDIKPSNLLVDGDDRLWVADFGLARVRGDSELTASGDVIGTLRYLSPEQARGRREGVDGRSDVYGLGATLFELLTLRPAIDGDDRAEILNRILSEEPRFTHKDDSAIPFDLRTIVLKAIAKDPADRYTSAGEMADDLARFLADRPIRASRPTLASRAARLARRHGRMLFASALVATGLLVAIVGLSLRANTRLRSINQRLEAEIQRADRHAREANEQAQLSERHALGAQLRLAAQAVEAGQAERAQEILRDISINTRRNAPRSFAWRFLRHRARREIEVLVGPTPKFESVALSPDGSMLATVDPSAGLALRDTATGMAIRMLGPRPLRLGRPVFSPDGSLLAAVETTTDPASAGISIWEVSTGRRLTRWPIARGPESSRCGFLPGGSLLEIVFGTDDGYPAHSRIWELRGESTPRLVEEFDGGPTSLTEWRGGRLLTQENRKTLVLRDPATGLPVRRCRIEEPDGTVTASACSPGAEAIAAVSAAPWRLTIWDGRTGKRKATYPAPPNVDRLLFSPTGETLAGIDERQGVHLIDPAEGTVRTIIPADANHSRPTRVAFSPDGTRLATALAGRPDDARRASVSLWEVATGRRLAIFPGRAEELDDLHFMPDGKSVLISSQSGVRSWRFLRGMPDGERQPTGHADEAWAVAFSPDGRLVGTGSDDDRPDETIKLWDPMTGRLIRGWKAGAGTVASLVFSPDGSVLASGHLVSGANIRLWDPTDGKRLATLRGHTDRVRAVTFSPDGQWLASASSDGTVRIWDAAARQERQVLRGHADTVHAVAFSPDGRRLASAGNDGDIRLWSVGTGDQPVSPDRILPNRTNLMAIVFSPDGQSLAVADALGAITLWDIARSSISQVIHSDGEEIRQLAFSPGGGTLAAGGIKGRVRLWDPVTGQELVSVAAHRSQVNGLAFSPDGLILGSAAHDGSVRLWRADR